MRRALAPALLAMVAACSSGSPSVNTSDGGGPGGDAAMTSDAPFGLDAAVTPDAPLLEDAPTHPDAATQPDAHLRDAAANPDARLPDAATTPDAAANPDARLPDAAANPDARLPDAAIPDAAIPDAAIPDARLPDAAPPDGGVTAPLSIGAAVVAQRVYGLDPTTGTMTTGAVATQAGSLLLASAARGLWESAPDAPTDNYTNNFALVGATHTYADWPTSQTGLFRVPGAAGGAGHAFSLTWGDFGHTGDEITLSVVEVRGAASIDSSSFVERSAANSLTSAPITTTGPALLVAWWWGSGGLRPVGSMHIAVPGDGFKIIPEATALTAISTAGYIQVAVASRAVASAGTYTVTWTTDNEGAQLYVIALRSD